jgi:hypothetical protein
MQRKRTRLQRTTSRARPAAGTMPGMRTLLLLALAGTAAFAAAPDAQPPVAAASTAAPAADDAPRLPRPDDYRTWIYLSTGFDMSYNPALRKGHDMFDNVFVNPEAWRAFQASGTWPEGTTFVLEGRGAVDRGSINRQGRYQSTELMGLEVHVKDSARYPGGWAFFGFDGAERSARMIPTRADCYSCHAAHGAVDTTFVQFYPTLLPLAEAKGTLSAAYRAESAGGDGSSGH